MAYVRQSEVDDWTQAIRKLKYKDWKFNLILLGSEYFLQITFEADGKTQRCRMWHLWSGMNEVGIVKTAWMAILAAEEHEAREIFRYDGVKVFNPHVTLEHLMGAKLKANIADTEDP